MKDRYPMKFAFIGSCGGMDDLGSYTFSHEFRKGQMKDTVTVGYNGMDKHPDWYGSGYNNAISWQDEMFSYMDKGYSVRYAFDKACDEYPIIAKFVVFCGDETVTIVDSYDNNEPEKPEISGPGLTKLFKETSFKISAEDSDYDQVYYKIDWGYEIDWKDFYELIGPYDSSEEVEISHSYNIPKSYDIKVKTIDSHGSESEWSKPFDLRVNTMPSIHKSTDKQLIKNFLENIYEKYFRDFLPKILR